MDSNLVFRDVVDPIGYVRSMACRVTALYPSCLHMEDVAGEGLLALVLALRRFDSRRGVRFSTYAWPRIRGAMVDLIRTESRRRRFLQREELPEQASENSVEENVLDRESIDHLHHAVSRLPARQAQYLNEFLGGHTEVLVCRRLGITRGAGRELRQRAFVNLRRALSADQEKVPGAAA
jgi:RNA polymerase sigma factor (sigma-70 family)